MHHKSVLYPLIVSGTHSSVRESWFTSFSLHQNSHIFFKIISNLFHDLGHPLCIFAIVTIIKEL